MAMAAQRIQELLETHRDRLPLVDLLLNFFVLTPLIVLHYHATCQVLDYILCSTFPRFGPCLLFVAGIAGVFAFAYYQKRIPIYIEKQLTIYVKPYMPDDAETPRLLHMAAARIYTLALTFITLAHMKAVTDLFLMETEGSMGGSIRAAVTSIVILWAMRGSRNILSAPLSIGLDKDDNDAEYHVFPTAFQVEPSESTESAADAIATIGIAYSMNHLHWAGVTTLLDNILFPNYFWLSVLSSLAIGYGLCFAVILYQHEARKISIDLEKNEARWLRLAFEDAFIFLSGFAVITTWRGLWMTIDAMTFSFPVYMAGLDITCFVGWSMSFGILMVGRLTNSLPYKGYDRDGDQLDGLGCICATDWLIDIIKDLDKQAQKEESTKAEVSTVKDSKTPAPSSAAAGVQQNGAPTKKTSEVDAAAGVRRRTRPDSAALSSTDLDNGVKWRSSDTQNMTEVSNWVATNRRSAADPGVKQTKTVSSKTVTKTS